MKIRKFLTGMTAGIMAVSSAIVCQISAGAVDVTLVSGTAVASWKDITVDISKAGTDTEYSSLEISCPAPDGAVENQRLFNVILNDADWDSPTYSASYDSSKTEFSVTVPGSALTGKSNVMIQASDIGVNVTVKAVLPRTPVPQPISLSTCRPTSEWTFTPTTAPSARTPDMKSTLPTSSA